MRDVPAREICSEISMNSYFRRQLADYVEYHRDWWNWVMHVFGLIFLFLAAILPLNFWSVHVFGGQTTMAAMMVLPVLIYWLLLDTALGMGIVGAAVLLLSTAAIIVSNVSVGAVWSISAVLMVVGVGMQIIGHRVFERRPPALLDNPPHLLLGPMFVMAKVFLALRFTHDLPPIIDPVPRTAALGAPVYS